MSIISIIKENPKLKKLVHRLLIPKNDFRPRLWVRVFVNPFKHFKSKSSIIRSSVRMDVFPFNEFSLGKKSLIEDFCTINNGVGNVIIGDCCVIGMSNVIIGPVKIGDHTILAQNIVISGLNHGYEDINIPPSQQKVAVNQIIIGDNVWIGANTVITAGVTIGKHAIIGAGSVVTKNVPDYCVTVGNPAKIVKKYNFETNVWDKVK